MSNIEKMITVKDEVDIIDATARRLNENRGEVARILLQERKIPLTAKKAALRIRTEELIKQNPKRLLSKTK